MHGASGAEGLGQNSPDQAGGRARRQFKSPAIALGFFFSAIYDQAANQETDAMTEELAEAIQDIELEALELDMVDDLDEHDDL